MAADWAAQHFPQARFEVLSEEGHTPALFFEIAATDPSKPDVFFYGHFDKQPEAEGWSEGRSPFTPTLEGDALYGRGCADDGYAFYSAVTALKALDAAGIGRGRATGLIETDEESGSADIEYWLHRIADKVNNCRLAVVLDSTAGDYARLWATMSFRGCINMTLRVKVLEHAVHSGTASGIVPDSFMIARQLLSRLEDPVTGRIADARLNVPIDSVRQDKIRRSAQVLGEALLQEFPWADGVQPRSTDVVEAVTDRSFRPQLAVLGADGLPDIAHAGRVMRPETALALSVRTPPGLDVQKASEALTDILTSHPPYNAQVRLDFTGVGPGWCAKTDNEAFYKTLDAVSQEVFGADAGYVFDGASIPILDLMNSFMPQAQFLVTGVLGPHSNAHGPDEMLHLTYCEKLIQSTARIVAAASKEGCHAPGSGGSGHRRLR
ncbi:MAG: M20/M25/M40 family metallo-hydrolase, partial [Duodenibacillus sp.]